MTIVSSSAVQAGRASTVCSTSDRPSTACSCFQHRQPTRSRKKVQKTIQPPLSVVRASAPDTAQTAAPSAEEQERLASLGGVVTDAAVPEGHKGLHGFLYGEGGAEEHDSNSAHQFRHGEDDGQTIAPMAEYLGAREGEKPVGVYALYDARRELQYVGFSRNVVLAIKGHLERVGEERASFVRAMVFANRAMATRSNLEREAANWIDEAGTTPPGNVWRLAPPPGPVRRRTMPLGDGENRGVEAHLWAGGVSAAMMTPAEREAYEEKKLKMRKAMGENLGDAVEGETPDAAQRRLNLIRAVEGDDWSSVIDGQTAETAPPPPPEAAAVPPPQIESPFSHANVHRTIGNREEAPAREMTIASVDAALDEVRPYLISDGGNVTVAGIQDGVVMLQLEGACGTCPSSTATMKMGLERALQSAFGDTLKGVQQVGAIDTSATVASVDAHLDVLRPAIQNYGGSVVVQSVERGVCTVKYDGPPPIAMGVKAAIKDKFPDIKQVVLAE